MAPPMEDATDESMVAPSKENIEYLAERRFKLVSNVMDNVPSNAIRAYIKQEQWEYN